MASNTPRQSLGTWTVATGKGAGEGVAVTMGGLEGWASGFAGCVSDWRERIGGLRERGAAQIKAPKASQPDFTRFPP